jgi:hypothetical protein
LEARPILCNVQEEKTHPVNPSVEIVLCL